MVYIVLVVGRYCDNVAEHIGKLQAAPVAEVAAAQELDLREAVILVSHDPLGNRWDCCSWLVEKGANNSNATIIKRSRQKRRLDAAGR